MKKDLLAVSLLVLLASCSSGTSSSLAKESSTSEESSIQESVSHSLYIKTVKQYLTYAPSEIMTYLDKNLVKDLDLYYEIMDESICEIKDGYVTGLKVGQTTVYASMADGTEASFEVYINDPNTYKFNREVQTMEEQYRLHGNYQEGATIFIGDSFFDYLNLWRSFYDDFTPSQKCICLGISSSETTDWVMARDRLLFNFKPKNVVMHIGTNDINDINVNLSVDEYYNQITYFLKMSLEGLPNTKFYYFGIEDRKGPAGGKNYYSQAVTAKIKDEFAPSYSNFTYIDSPSVYNADQDKYIRGDNIHPSDQGYAYYVKVLNELVTF